MSLAKPELPTVRRRGAFLGFGTAYENRLVAVLTLTYGVVMTDRLAINFLAPFIVSDLKLHNTQIGLMATGLSLTWAVSGVVVSRWCDRFGHQRRILCAAVLAFSACSLLSGFAASFGVLLLTRILMGLSEGPVLPISQDLLVLASSPTRRGLNMGVMQQFGSNILGLFVAPILLVGTAQVWGWRTAFFVAAAPGLLCAVLLWRTVREPSTACSGPNTPTAFSLAALLRARNIPICMAMSGLIIGWTLLVFVFLPLLFVRNFHFSSAYMSLLMSILGLSAVISSVLVPGLSDRVGRKAVIIPAIGMGLLIPLGVGWAGSSFAWSALSLFAGFMAAGATPLIVATVPAETAAGLPVATVISLVLGVAEVSAGFLGPLLGGVVADRFGLQATLWLQAALLLAVLLLACGLKETTPKMRPR